MFGINTVLDEDMEEISDEGERREVFLLKRSSFQLYSKDLESRKCVFSNICNFYSLYFKGDE